MSLKCKQCDGEIGEGGFTLDTNIAFLTIPNGVFHFCSYKCGQEWYEAQANLPSEMQARRYAFLYQAGMFTKAKTA